eukprot:scpid68508/ scgid14974/ Sorting nexin-27
MAEEIDESPHPVIVRKNHLGFGFNVRGQVNEGGTLKPIKGQLYAPMQYVSAVLENGPAKEGGLRLYDRILEINGESAEGLKHGTVVEMIRRSTNDLRLTVISVSQEEAAHLDSNVAMASSQAPHERDMTEKRALPITIPDSKDLADNQSSEPYTVFNIFLSGRHVAARRYSEFDQLLSKLKERFPDFPFPRLPMKWPWKLNAQATDQRRRGLEEWIDQVCAYRAIAEDEVMMEFLKQGQGAKPSSPKATTPTKRTVELRAILPDSRAVSIDVEQAASCTSVFESVCGKAKLSTEASCYFALFEVNEADKFYRKIRPNEFPHRIYTTNHPSQTSSSVFLRRWIFTPYKELTMRKDEVALNFFYRQAKEDVQKKRIVATTAEVRGLQALAEAEEKVKYLKAVRKIDKYGGVTFPHCPCDMRKTGKIMVTVQRAGLLFAACDDDGVLQGQETAFGWSDILVYETDLEEEAFVLKYTRNNKEKFMRVYSKYYEYMLDCVEKAHEEQEWEDEGSSNGSSAGLTPVTSEPTSPTTAEPLA